MKLLGFFLSCAIAIALLAGLGLGSSFASVILVILAVAVSSFTPWGIASLVGVAVVSPASGALVGLLAGQPLPLLPLCAVSIASVVAVQMAGQQGPRVSLPVIASLGLFSAWVFWRANEYSFYYYNPNSFTERYDSSNLVYLALVIILVSALIVQTANPSKEALLVTVAVLGPVFAITSLLAVEGNTIWLARSAALGVLAVLLLKMQPLFKLVLVVPGLLAMAILGKDGPILGLAVGVLILALARLPSRARVFGYIAVAGLVVITLAFTSTLFEAVEGDVNASSRLTFWSQAWDKIQQNVLFGSGFSNALDLGVYPHNSVLDIWMGLGVVGLALWIGIQTTFLVRSAQVGLLPLLVAALTFSLFSGHFVGNPEYWLLGGFACALWWNQRAVGEYHPRTSSKPDQLKAEGRTLEDRTRVDAMARAGDAKLLGPSEGLSTMVDSSDRGISDSPITRT